MITRQLVYAMEPGGGDENLTEAYSTLGFLYGTIPTAPSVFLFASYYQESVTIVSISLSSKICFFVCSYVFYPILPPCIFCSGVTCKQCVSISVALTDQCCHELKYTSTK